MGDDIYLPPIRRFSDRVEDYKKFRPSYPQQILSFLSQEEVIGLKRNHLVADIGYGTGLSSLLFLENGNTVLGVEPNDKMREGGEEFLQHYIQQGRFKSFAGTAECTNLPDHSVDLIIVGQAFHWFQEKESKVEFRRILKPKSESGLKDNVVLFWNARKTKGIKFWEEYEALIKEYRPQELEHDHSNLSTQAERFRSFFLDSHFSKRIFPNSQTLDFSGVKGRTLSISFCPKPGSPEYDRILDRLKKIYDDHVASHKLKNDSHNLSDSNNGGGVTFAYETTIFYGTV